MKLSCHSSRITAFMLSLLLMFTVFTPAFGASVTGPQKGNAAGTAIPADMEGHWAKAALTEWLAKGRIQSYPDGTFKPDRSITRGEFAALVNRSFGFREESEIVFADLKPSDWAYEDIGIAVKAGYMEGYEDGTVGADKSITRQEAAVITARLLGLDLADGASGAETFGDAGQMADWSRGSIAAVAAIGVMEGYDSGRFEPGAEITRAEAVVTLERASTAERTVTTVYDKAGTYGPADEAVTVNGDVSIAADGVTLRNMIITGDLLLAEGIGEGDVYLKNVTVKGMTTIQGGGANSVHLEDSRFVTIVINKREGTVRVVAAGKTTAAEVVLESSAIVEAAGLTGAGLLKALLAETMPEDARVQLSGDFDQISIAAANVSIEVVQGKIKELIISRPASGVMLQLDKETSILSLMLDAIASFTGQGGIINATISEYAKGTKFERQPNKMTGSGAPSNSPAATADSGAAPTATSTPAPTPTATAPTPTPTASTESTPTPTASTEPTPTPTAEPTPTPDALLVKNGVANADIFVSSSAGDLEQFAAAELQSTISMISGAELPIVKGDMGSEAVSAKLPNSEMNVKRSGVYPFHIDLINNSGNKSQVNFTQTDDGPLVIESLTGIELAIDAAIRVNGMLRVPASVTDGTYKATIQASANGIALEPLTLTVQLDRNIIYNSDFEAANLDGWWTPPGVGVWDSGVSHSGGHAMRMDMVDAGYTYSRTDRELHLEPGQEYVLQAWMKGEKAGRATVEFRELKNGVGDIPGGSAKHTVAVGEDWTLVEVRYTRNPEHVFDFNWINFWSYSQSGGGTGKLWIDDAKLSIVEKEEQDVTAEPEKDSITSAEVENAEERIRIILATPESFAGLSERFADDLAFLQESDGFAIRRSGNRIYIMGFEPRGVLNGMYDFLEKNTGILWTRSTDVGTIYEPTSTIKADQTDYREKSPFQVRGWHTTGIGVTGVPKYDFGTMKMLSRNKLNAKFAEFANLASWGEYESLGIKSINLGHDLGYWLPNGEFFASHPDYYNWENGAYVPVSAKTQINFYHPDVPGVIAEKVKQFHLVHGTEYIGVGINDNNSFTQSEESRQPFTTPDGLIVQPDDPAYKSTVFFTFLNKVAAEVKKTYPDVKIVTFAYLFTETPPKVDLEDNIVIVMAPASEDERIPLNTSNTESNNYKYKVMVEQWTQKTKNVVMYNYYGCCYAYSYERPIAEKVQADMQYYRDLGLMGILPEGVLDARNQAWGVNALQFWLFHKLFWNPDADLEALKLEFMQKAYGAAAAPMKRYYELIEQGWNYNQLPINWYSNESQLIGQYISAAGIKNAARSALDEAWQLADEKAKARIEPIRSTFNQMVFLYDELPNLSANAVKTTATKEEILQSLDFSAGPWANAEPITTFLVMKSRVQPPVETKAYLLWDDENLYVGYENFDAQQAGMVVSDDAPKGWWRKGADDSAETHLASNEQSTTYAFFTNPKEVKFVYKTGPKLSLDTPFEVSAETKSDRWNVIQAIPFASFGFDPKGSSTFQALFFRNYHGDKGLFGWGGGTVWSPADLSPVHLIEK